MLTTLIENLGFENWIPLKCMHKQIIMNIANIIRDKMDIVDITLYVKGIKDLTCVWGKNRNATLS